MPVDAAELRPVLRLLADLVPGLAPDTWAPSVQGAVGHVVGASGPAGDRYVLKLLPPAVADRLPAEVAALGLLAGVPEVPVPAVVAHGSAPGGGGYLLMTRLDGVRWADRRARLDATTTSDLTAEVGRALRRVHGVPGPWFGDLTGEGPGWPTAWDRVQARTGELLAEHRRVGGAADLGDRVRVLVHDHRHAFRACEAPVLCHGDLVDGNVLVSDDDAARLSGVVDLERAGWDDPMADLALTLSHVRQHVPGDAEVLVAGYGALGPDEQARLGVHEVLHLVAERSWVAHDRPSGWGESVERLDGLVRARV
ncbi:phosphotransferase family protein [Cellulomonas endometrii]|uniref:phosphotransferase family protein n=1 Tax=Cellulomonas endometrii TaxID=3036301 RepID=UPI0024AE100B|nr:aminoglycoside phosphotransferase family protein [Cellulomonas endometrii]